jgi:hypothetical protein
MAVRRKGMWGWIAMALAPALLGVPTVASADTITVNDENDPNGTGCTLEHAIIAANTNTASGNCPPGSGSVTDVINFNLTGLSTITLTGALPDITTNIDIVGPGSSLLSVSGDGKYRPFRYTKGFTVNSISGLNVTDGFCDNSCPSGAEGGGIIAAGTLTLTDVTLTANAVSIIGGTDAFPGGGGIATSGGTLHLVLSSVSGNMVFAMNATHNNGAEGGGIWNNGTLTLDRSTVADNTVTASAGGGDNATALGGGILNLIASTSISRSTISGNSASATGGTAANNAIGGGVEMTNAMNVAVTLDRTTITGNSVSSGNPAGTVTAGGIFATGIDGSAFTVVSSTISGNTAPDTANLAFGGETQSIKNSIISNPLGGGVNCNSASTASQGFNLEDTNTCGFGLPTDKPSTNPMLDAVLGGNGGPTRTLALLTGSPAIESGSSSPGETTDQRGLLRPSDDLSVATAPGSDGADIGAFEVQGQPFPAPPTITPPTTSPPTTTAHRKKCKKRKHRAAAAKKKCRKRK